MLTLILEHFLPFQLETLSSALIVLLVIRAVSRTRHNVPLLEERAHLIFDEMIAQRNPIARYRKAEAIHVGELLTSLDKDLELATSESTAISDGAKQGFPTPASPATNKSNVQNDHITINNACDSTTRYSTEAIPPFPLEPNDEFLVNFGLSSEAINCVANQVLFDTPLDDLAYWTSMDVSYL